MHNYTMTQRNVCERKRKAERVGDRERSGVGWVGEGWLAKTTLPLVLC